MKNETSLEIKEKSITLHRVFAAPVELVFKTFTEPDHVSRWWGPHIMTNPICKIDLRIGGEYYFVMRGPDGTDYPMRGTYTEIEKNKKITFSVDLKQHPKDWFDMIKQKTNGTYDPAKLITSISITFEKQNESITKVSVISNFDANVVRDAFLKMGMKEGWSESFEKLDLLLITL